MIDNNLKLSDVYTIQQLTSMEKFATYKVPELIVYLQRKGCKKLVLDGVFSGKIVFLKSEVDKLKTL